MSLFKLDNPAFQDQNQKAFYIIPPGDLMSFSPCEDPCGPDHTRHSLIRDAIAQDPKAVDKLIRVYGPYLVNKCRTNLGLSLEDAEDVVQETFVKVLNNLPELEVREQPGSFRAWLRKSLVWTTQDWIKRNDLRNPRGEGGTDHHKLIALLEAREFHEESQAEVADWYETVIKIVQSDCDEATWRGFELYVIEGLSSAEVGAMLGKSERWAQGVKARIVRKLRQEFRELGLIQ
jgi:RNA polymerase sigma factor (sigma-70 family)